MFVCLLACIDLTTTSVAVVSAYLHVTTAYLVLIRTWCFCKKKIHHLAFDGALWSRNRSIEVQCNRARRTVVVWAFRCLGYATMFKSLQDDEEHLRDASVTVPMRRPAARCSRRCSRPIASHIHGEAGDRTSPCRHDSRSTTMYVAKIRLTGDM